jgi:hypothetical protein
VYHLELRQFPHNLCRFNLSEQQLRAIAEPWARDQWVDLGERKWSPHLARLTILEGPQIPVGQLSMGRGWRTAQRRSEDVTERVLRAAKQAGSAPRQAPAQGSSTPPGRPGESPGQELHSLLGDEPASLLEAWRLVAARFPDRPPSECLALAEVAVKSAGGRPS